MRPGERQAGAYLGAIHAWLDGLTSDDWSGYADDLGDYAGRCELFVGPWVNGYRTGSVFAVVPDCDCGCHPPTPAEMHFIASARGDIPTLLAEVRQLYTVLDTLADLLIAAVEGKNDAGARYLATLADLLGVRLPDTPSDTPPATALGGPGMEGSGR